VDEGRPSGVRTVNLNLPASKPRVDFLSPENLDILAAQQQGKNYRDFAYSDDAKAFERLTELRGTADQLIQDVLNSRGSNVVNLNPDVDLDLPYQYQRAQALGTYKPRGLNFGLESPHTEAMQAGVQQDQMRGTSASRQQQEMPRGGAEINVSNQKTQADALYNSYLSSLGNELSDQGSTISTSFPPRYKTKPTQINLNDGNVLSELIDKGVNYEGTDSDLRLRDRGYKSDLGNMYRLDLSKPDTSYLFSRAGATASPVEIGENEAQRHRNLGSRLTRANEAGDKISIFNTLKKWDKGENSAEARAKRQAKAEQSSIQYVRDALAKIREEKGTVSTEDVLKVQRDAEELRKINDNRENAKSLLGSFIDDLGGNSETSRALKDLQEDFDGSLGSAGLSLDDIELPSSFEEQNTEEFRQSVNNILGSTEKEDKYKKGNVRSMRKGIDFWPQEIKNSIFVPTQNESGTDLLRIRPEIAVQLAGDDLIYDFHAEDLKTVAEAMSAGEKEFKGRLIGLKSILSNTQDQNERAQIQQQITDLESTPLNKRASVFMKADPLVDRALDNITGTAVTNLFANDPNATIANAIINAGEVQPIATKGQGYTEQKRLKGTGFSVDKKETKTLGGRSSTANMSDYVPIYKHKETEEIGTSQELGLLPGVDGDAEEINGILGREFMVVGYEPRGRTGKYTWLTNQASGKPQEDLLDPDTAYAAGVDISTIKDPGKNYYGRKEFDPEEDRQGQYVGGVRGFYENSSSKEARELKPVPTYGDLETGEISTADIASAINDGVLKITKGNNGKQLLMYTPPNRLLYRDQTTLKNSNNTSKFNYASGISPEGMPYKPQYLDFNNKNAAKLLLAHNQNANLFNQEVDNLDRVLSRGEVETSRSIIPEAPDAQQRLVTGKTDEGDAVYGQTFASLVRDIAGTPERLVKLSNEFPEVISQLGISQQDIPNLMSVVDPASGGKERIPLTVDMSNSGGARYTQFRKTQAPVDTVNTGLSLLLGLANETNNQAGSMTQRRLAALPSVYVPGQKEGEKGRTLSAVSNTKEYAVQNAQEYGNLLFGKEGKKGLVDIDSEQDNEKSLQTIESILDELLKTGDTLSEDQKRKFTGFVNAKGKTGVVKSKKDLISNKLYESLSAAESAISSRDPGSGDYNRDDALAVGLVPDEDKTSKEQILAYYENLVDPAISRYGSGFFPLKGKVIDALDYNVAVPIGGSEDTYIYQEGGNENLGRTFLATQLAQMGAQQDFGLGTIPGKKGPKQQRPLQIKSLNTALQALQRPDYKFAGNTPIETKALIDSSTISQVSRPGYKVAVTEKGGRYTGNDARETISSYTLDKATGLLANAQNLLDSMDPSDPRYHQTLGFVQSLQKDVSRLTPKNNRVTPYIPQETDPDLYLQRFGELDSENYRRGVRGRVSEPNIYANEISGNTVRLADVNDVVGVRDAQSNTDTSQATARPSGQTRQSTANTFTPRTRSPLEAIQNPGGDLREQVAARQNQLNQVLANLNRTAAQTPGGNMPLSTARLPLGQGGGSMVAAVKDKSGRIIGINPIPGAEGSAQPLVPARVLQGPNQASATETIQEYGLTPAQLQAVANTTMSRAKQKNAAMNVAKQNLAAEQMELLDQIPQGKYTPSPLSSVIDYNLENVSPEGRDFIRMLQGRSALRRANARAILPNALHSYSPAIADSKGDSYSNIRNAQLNLPI
jgi:hypothetical protein